MSTTVSAPVTVTERHPARFPPVRVELGSFEYALDNRTLVIGAVRRATGDRCASLRGLRGDAESLLAAGADAVDITDYIEQSAGRGAAAEAGADPGADPERGRHQLGYLADVVGALRADLGVPLTVATPSVDTLRAVLSAGVDVVSDPGGRLEPDYLVAVAQARTSLVVTPPSAVLTTASGPQSITAIEVALRSGAERAMAAGIAPERIVLDAGAERAVNADGAQAVLGATARFVALGFPVQFTVPAAPRPGSPAPPLLAPPRAVDTGEPGTSPRLTAAAAIALAIVGGVRLVRTADVREARRVGDVLGGDPAGEGAVVSALHLLRGDDEVLLAEATTDLVHELVGAGDRTLVVTEFDGDDYLLAAVVDAAQTPPFLTERRVVVARGLQRFTADAVGPLIAYLAEPLDTTDLVLDGVRRTPPQVVARRRQAGRRRSSPRPVPAAPARSADQWIDERLATSDVRLDAGARAAVAGWLGEDVGRLPALLETLESARGPAGSASPMWSRSWARPGAVPPWDLTDAIDRGDTAVALDDAGPLDAGRGTASAGDHGHPPEPLRAHAAPRRLRACRPRERGRPPQSGAVPGRRRRQPVPAAGPGRARARRRVAGQRRPRSARPAGMAAGAGDGSARGPAVAADPEGAGPALIVGAPRRSLSISITQARARRRMDRPARSTRPELLGRATRPGATRRRQRRGRPPPSSAGSCVARPGSCG